MGTFIAIVQGAGIGAATASVAAVLLLVSDRLHQHVFSRDRTKVDEVERVERSNPEFLARVMEWTGAPRVAFETPDAVVATGTTDADHSSQEPHLVRRFKDVPSVRVPHKGRPTLPVASRA
jgi:hypothetical protein